MAPERRRADRYDTSISILIRFLPDGTPIKGATSEIGPNGMRIQTQIPLVEASYVHISFESATNNTHCEGRVVWTRRAANADKFESGIDIQRWSGGIPGADAVGQIPDLKSKKDRRKKAR